MATPGKDLYEQGLARERAGDFPGAFEAFRLSAQANPRVAAPYVALSRILLRNQQRADAIACLERAIVCENENATLHTLLGRAPAIDGNPDRAGQCFRHALRLDPLSVDAAVGCAGVLEDLGARADAAAVYRELLGRVPDAAEAIAGLLGVVENAALDEAIETAQAQVVRASNADASLIGYALGKALARRGDTEAAFAAWARANATRRSDAGNFDRERFDRRIDRLIRIFSPEFMCERAGWGQESELPVFIVGLPRSGTTLTEQILASHPQIHGAGELDLLTDLATATPDVLGRRQSSWPETALELKREHVDTIGRQHLERLQSMAPSGPARITDKQPLNFWHLGLVALTLPGARIVHCTRDIRDNGLSIFAENFTPEQRWATELSDIAHYWRGYRRLMAHWRKVTGLNMMEVAYEDMIADTQSQAARLTEFLGLPWHPDVLRFHETGRAVQTPSRWQVRRPIYGTSAGRWRDYEQHIAPLRRAFAMDAGTTDREPA